MSNTTLRIATAFHSKTEGSVSAHGGEWVGSRWSKAVQPPVERTQGQGQAKRAVNPWMGRECGGEER